MVVTNQGKSSICLDFAHVDNAIIGLQCIHVYRRILILWFASKTANPPNLIPRQYFRLYGMDKEEQCN